MQRTSGDLLVKADPLISRKIESLIHCIDRIEQKRPDSLDILEKDFDLQDIISVNLERAVQQCVDCAFIMLSNSGKPVPATMGEAFGSLEELGIITEKTGSAMQRAAGFRNMLVHAYRKIDWSIIWNIINNNLDDFRVFISEITGW